MGCFCPFALAVGGLGAGAGLAFAGAALVLGLADGKVVGGGCAFFVAAGELLPSAIFVVAGAAVAPRLAADGEDGPLLAALASFVQDAGSWRPVSTTNFGEELAAVIGEVFAD